MNRLTEIPLDSYRLAQYAQHVPCFVCDGPNAFDAELCRHCSAPMALGHQAKRLKRRPYVVTVLGCSGAGKTVFLGMLMDMLSREQSNLQVLARGAFSITLQQSTVAALSECQFPDKTPNEPDQWNWVHCLVNLSRRHNLEMIMPDMAGEAILEEVDHPHTYPVIRPLLEQSAGAFLVLDAIRMREGRHEQEHFAMKVLSFLSELETGKRHSWHEKPIAVILTKADQVEPCFDNPTSFVEEHAPGAAKICRQRFKKTSVFASGVAGSCAYRTVLGGHRVRIPLRVEPRGVCEPFTWMVGKLRNRGF